MLRHTCPRAQNGRKQPMEGCPDFCKTGSFSCLGASAQGAGISFDAYLEACWGALWGRRLEGTIFVLYRTPASGHHLSFFFSFAFFFHFLFSFPVGTISTLFLCLCPLQLVGTIFVLSPSHTPGCQHLLEGSFYTHLVPQFLHLVPQFLLLPGGGS